MKRGKESDKLKEGCQSSCHDLLRLSECGEAGVKERGALSFDR
jgi:hypothetical protein